MSTYTKYPDQVDTSTELPKATDLVTPVNGEAVNRLREAILAIENELGAQPSGTFSTVRARLDAMDIALLSLGANVSEIDPTIEILQDSTSINANANAINFTGNVAVTDTGTGVNVEIIGGQATQIQEAFEATDGQTSFTLSNTPFQENGVQMFVNGVKMRYSVDYTVTETTVTYLDDIELITGDEVEFWYLVDSAGLSSSDVSIGNPWETTDQIISDSGSFSIHGTTYVQLESAGGGIGIYAQSSGELSLLGGVVGVTAEINFEVSSVNEMKFGTDSGSVDIYDDSVFTTRRVSTHMPDDVITSATTKVALLTVSISTERPSTFRGSVAGWPTGSASQFVDISFNAENIAGTVSIIGSNLINSGAALGTVTAEVVGTDVIIYTEPVDATAYTWRCNLTEER